MKASLDVYASIHLENPFFLQVFHCMEENFFLDECGQPIHNIFELITPNDLFLYREDPGHNIFPLRDHKDVWVEILNDYDDPYWWELEEVFSHDDILDHPDLHYYKIMRGEDID